MPPHPSGFRDSLAVCLTHVRHRTIIRAKIHQKLLLYLLFGRFSRAARQLKTISSMPFVNFRNLVKGVRGRRAQRRARTRRRRDVSGARKFRLEAEELEPRWVLATLTGSEAFGPAEALRAGTYHVALDGPQQPAPLVATAVGATIDLAGAPLELQVTSDPGFGTSFTIVDVRDPTSTVGQSRFHDLPEGATFAVDGFRFTITYSGGVDANDVVLRRPDPSTSIRVDTGRLLVSEHSPAANHITISIDDDDLLLTDRAGAGASGLGLLERPEGSVAVPLSDVQSISIETGDGDDTLIIDVAGGVLSRPLVYRGGGNGSLGDALSFIDSSGSLSIPSMVFEYFDEHSGTVAVGGGGLVEYAELEPVNSTINVDDVVLNYSNVDETITISSAGSDTRVDSTSGEVTTFPNPGRSLTINAGGGSDTVDVNGFGSGGGGFRAGLFIDGGGGGSDAVNVNADVVLGSVMFAGDLNVRATDIVLNESVQAVGGGRGRPPCLTASRINSRRPHRDGCRSRCFDRQRRRLDWWSIHWCRDFRRRRRVGIGCDHDHGAGGRHRPEQHWRADRRGFDDSLAGQRPDRRGGDLGSR